MSTRRSRVTRAIRDAGAVAVIRVSETDRLLPLVEALVAGGLRGIEITMTVPGAIDQIALVHRTFGDRVLLGVGSVLDGSTARAAVEAGATYVVSPVLKPEVIRAAHNLDAAVMPGAFTPTEIQTAHEAGADIVKVFPADVVGMAFFRAVLAPMPHLNLMPTGGVSLENAGEWIRAGACAVGIGSALLDRKAITLGDWGRIEENARILIRNLESAR